MNKMLQSKEWNSLKIHLIFNFFFSEKKKQQQTISNFFFQKRFNEQKTEI